ncbi:F-box protein [Morus notabilis]|uniref:F-box protein n=1 Tax=Morus notabilis TaxID=981085 RepID=W9SGR5_9ROSA|nr:F-box protein [Morus notabilis]
MSNPVERYQKLGFKESFVKIHRYPLACKELGFILRAAYTEFPKNLQALIVQDTITAFRLLPGMQTRSAVSGAHVLLQSAEASLPKQKKNLVVAEFKQAMVAHKRRCKARKEEKGSAHLPQDILVHVFSFLDMQSLVSAELVCWSWNLAASDNQLWHAQYAMLFGNSDNNLKISGSQRSKEIGSNEYVSLREEVVIGTSIDWKEAFKRECRGTLSKKLRYSRGYCENCKTIVWVDNLKCSNEHCRSHSEVKPVTASEVVEYILDGSTSFSTSSSDSESDSEEDSLQMSRLWAYPY